MPHGQCYLWRSDILWLNVGSDVMVALAYFSIPLSIIYFLQKRKGAEYNWVFWMFAHFIVACGATHMMGAWTVWNPDYGWQGLVKAYTGVVSIATAVTLWYFLPKALRLPTASQLRQANADLGREVMERQKLCARLQSQNKKLKESERLERAFIANVSHDLRTPLTLILSPLEAIMRGVKSGGELSPDNQLVRIMHSNARRLNQMISSLLDLAKVEAGGFEVQKKPICLEQLIAGAVRDFGDHFDDKQIQLSVSVDKEFRSRPVWSDPYLLERIIFNLLSNALKFTPDGGWIEVTLNRRGPYCRLAVADSGPGIPADKQQILFEKFRQLDDGVAGKHEGMGLGLAIVKEFTEALGGYITVHNNPGAGSVFELEWPLKLADEAGHESDCPNSPLQPKSEGAERLPADAGQESQQGSPTRHDLPKVLIVEDHDDVAEFLVEPLSPVYQVEWSVDGNDALTKISESPPDIVVSDIMMPGIDGFELCRRLKGSARTQRIPVILLSALIQTETMQRGFELGVDQYLTKPCNENELKACIRSLIDRKVD
jgi:signal transduction histidine kinase/ActR/RegA family two-component response regulator